MHNQDTTYRSTYVPATLDHEQPLRNMLEQPVTVVDTSPVYLAQRAATERTSNTDRARGLVIRLMPVTGLQLVLSMFLAVVAGWAWPWGLVLWGGMSSLTHVAAIWLDFTFSNVGLERHRIDAATRVQLAKLGHEATLRHQALQEFTKALERRHE